MRCDGEIDDGADRIDIDAGRERRGQHHADPGFRAIVDGERLQPHQLGAAQAPVDRVVDAVELQEHAVESGLRQRFDEREVLREAHAVAVQLHEVEAARAHRA